MGSSQSKANDATESSKRSQNILFVGNPGVGKSTLLSCLIKNKDENAELFLSDISIGAGLTDKLDIKKGREHYLYRYAWIRRY